MALDADADRLSAASLRGELRRNGSLVIDVKAIPRSPVSEVSEMMANGSLKVKLAAPPEKGKANDELCEVLAAFLDVPKRNVEVILGHTSQKKRVRVLL